MAQLKLQISLTALLFAFVFSKLTFAAESVTNDYKNNGTGHTFSHANHDVRTDGDFTFTVNTTSRYQQKLINDVPTFQHMEDQRRQVQEAQLEAYKRYLQSRKQQPSANFYLPKDMQARRDAYIKHIENRRELIEKMMDERRKAAEERRKAMQQKMHQTETTSARADNA